MKNILFVILFLASFIQINQAQSPNSFSYQAIVRDAGGSTINNQTVAFRISILQTTATGSAVYSESHSASTNNFGLVNLEIGGGTLISGDFSTIDWGSDDYFVQIELDAAGGNNYTTMGTSQLLSVPFAMYAKNSGDKTWEKSSNNALFSGGDVGIGDSNPTASLSITRPAQVGGKDHMLEIRTSDASDDMLSVGNGTSQSNSFLPVLMGQNHSLASYPGLSCIGATTLDSGSDPVLIFDARKLNAPGAMAPGSALSNRSLFQWRSYTTNYMTMTANGNLGIGTTTPDRTLHVNDVMRLEPRNSAPSNPSKGDIYFNGSTNKLMVYDGSTWQACW